MGSCEDGNGISDSVEDIKYIELSQNRTYCFEYTKNNSRSGKIHNSFTRIFT
jgi:hypothetical protein